MQNSNHQRPLSTTIRILAFSCIMLLLCVFLFPLKASAQSSVSPPARPTFRVNAGFNSRYRDSNWVPVQVSLSNNGADFSGFVSINVPAPSSGISKPSSVLTYQQAISLPSGSQKQVTLYVPISVGNQGSMQTITVDLLDANNQKVGSDVSTLRSIGPSDIFVGILSDQSTGFSPLSTVPLADPTASIITEQLNASTLPTMAEVLKNFNLIVLDNFTTSNLTKDQLTTLQNWVNQGGSLIVVGGPDWRRTLSPLPAGLLPVSVTGTATLPAKTPLLPIGSPTKGGPGQSTAPDAVQGAVTISTATPTASSTVALSSDAAPLLVQSKLGQGLLCYLAFDPTLAPVLNWSSAGALWQGLLLRTLGDQILVSGPSMGQTGSWRFASSSNNSGFSGLLQSTLPNMLPPTWLILVLLLGYVVVLGPVRFLLVRLLKKRDWSWRIALSVIVIFSALSYTLALQQKGTSIVSSSISVLQLGRPEASGTTAHVTTYVGVYVPNQGDFQVNIPGANLVQTFTDQSASAQEHPATILSAGQETDVKLQGVDIWTLRTLVAKHDRRLKGGITSHLVLQDNSTLRGTVTNTLPYALNNIYVLMSNHFKSLGSMAAGETKAVSLSLENSSTFNLQPASLADQIAASNNLPVPYGMYYNSSQRMNALQRHMAQLTTLSGESGYSYCGNTSCFSTAPAVTTSSGVIVNNHGALASGNGPLTQINGRDPLLVPGAAATIIGWADHFTDATDTIAVKGSRVAGTQETFIQAPLDVSFADPLSQSVNVPSDMVVGQLTDVQSQGNNAQTQSPGIYTLTAGSMTFEFALPQDFRLQSSSITMTEPSNLTQGGFPVGPGISTVTDVNHMRTYLYNWQKHNWDRFTFNQFTLTINNAQPYIDANGRIVTQFANQDVTKGTAVFGKPSLQLRGQVAS